MKAAWSAHTSLQRMIITEAVRKIKAHLDIQDVEQGRKAHARLREAIYGPPTELKHLTGMLPEDRDRMDRAADYTDEWFRVENEGEGVLSVPTPPTTSQGAGKVGKVPGGRVPSVFYPSTTSQGAG